MEISQALWEQNDEIWSFHGFDNFVERQKILSQVNFLSFNVGIRVNPSR